MRTYRREIAVCLLLTAAVFAVYGQMIHHDFINFDDGEYITENPHVRTGLTKENMIWAFTAFHSNNWHPLTWLSHALDCQLFGLNPGMHHIVNLLLHIANSILLFLLFKLMTGDLWQSAFVAALFALHPMHVESVAWASERKDVLGAFFWILTMLAYLRYAKQPELSRYLLIILLFTAGLMAKPMLVTLPFVLILTDYWPLKRLKTNEKLYSIFNSQYSILYEKLPLFFLAAASGVITVFAQKSGGQVRSLDTFPLGIRIGNALISYIKYILKLIDPRNLAFHYPYPYPFPVSQAVAAGFVLTALSVFIIRQRKQRPYLLMGWLWYLGTLVPVIGLVQVATQAYSDRYSYIPFIGLSLIIAWGIADLTEKWTHRRIILGIAAGLLLTVWTVLTYIQTTYWKNSITLFTHTLNVTENNYLAHNSLGAALEEQGRIVQAISHFREALQIKSDGTQAYYNMGVALEKQGKYEESFQHFSKAVKLKPDFVNALYNLGIALKRRGDIQAAVKYFSQAVQLRPDFAEAHNNLGTALSYMGKSDEAIRHYRESIRLRPDYAEAYNNLGTALKSQGKYQAAMQSYQKALENNPKFSEAHLNWGIALGTLGDHNAAALHFAEAIRLKPDFADAHYSLGVALSSSGKNDQALQHYQEALRLKPDFAVVHFNMGVLLAGQGDLKKAAGHFSEAVRIKPDYAEAYNNLGTIFALENNFRQAITYYSKALEINPNLKDTAEKLEQASQLLRQSENPVQPPQP